MSAMGHTLSEDATDDSGALAGQTVVLRPTEERHVDEFLAILTEPEVARWWPGYDRERVARELIGAQCFAIEAFRETVGLICFDEEDDPEYRHAGIDVALAPSAHGRGLGADAVRTLARHLIVDRGHHRIAIDPAADNVKAIRSYERVGFRRVGVLRRYERGPDGTWHDGLLMDLLAEELG
ncbi:aminoglycoside 6'-N-acetyltransferase [Pseudonocardia oroxyli]|uniref:Aminoglycoside 6'-N-acetyltransferase n=2 Tax=Pseudonocardiaceae TaxID=2070 RepID=A0A1G8BGA0_PSEOR|nr:aminoglycoside 6'-N-acetyltransferase [Pseudonocardia oroxyli]